MSALHEELESASLSAAVPSAPEDRIIFRLAQLVLLMDVAADAKVAIPTIDRLSYYDFFAANPFVVIGDAGARDEPDRVALLLAGFTQRQLSYATTGQRFASRRQRIRHDVALLVAYGLASISETGYAATAAGSTIARQFVSVYADSYRLAAGIVLRRLKSLSDARLRDSAERWLGRPWLLLDLFDDVTEQASTTRRRRGP